MTIPDNNPDGYFDIYRASPDISFENFWHNYVIPERPLIIQNIASDWRAASCWTEEYLHKKLSDEPSAKEATLWYWLQRNALKEDYDTPVIVDETLNSPDVFPRNQALRIWIHPEGNLSSWHYDATMVHVFNVQVTGKKQWILVSPETPLDCYPFTNFVIMDGKGDAILKNRIYTRFTLNAGDMLFLPALWFHTVVACDAENISLNWVFTKKSTQVVSRLFVRDYLRYYICFYLAKHKFALFRTIINKINALLPNYLRIIWQYDKLIESPFKPDASNLIAVIFGELSTLPKFLRHVDKIKPYLKTIKPVKRLNKTV